MITVMDLITAAAILISIAIVPTKVKILKLLLFALGNSAE